MGCLRKYYGNRKVVDIRTITGGETVGDYAGISFCKAVSFRQTNTASSTIYRGFVVRWDSQDNIDDEQVDLFYTGDNGATWATHSIWAAGSDITSELEMDCATEKQFLFVCVKGKNPQTVYYNNSTLQTVDMGSGAWAATLTAMTKAAEASAVDGFELTGDGVYQVAWRFYDSVRGVYSALSDPVTVRLNMMKLSTASGTIQFNAAGGDSGLMVSGDIFTINGRTYKYIAAGGDVTIPVVGVSTSAAHCQALADAINGDASAEVKAIAGMSTVTITANTSGADGNMYGLAVTEEIGRAHV
jgi:hypothetical protein